MRRALLVIVLATVAGMAGAVYVPGLAAQPALPRQIGQKTFSTVVEWQSGARDGLLISNNDNGELRLAENRAQGSFSTGALKADFPFNAAGAVWRADAPAGTKLALELRAGPAADQLGDWQPIAAGDARSQKNDGALALESVLPFAPGAQFFELRATFSTTVANASPVLSEITISYFDASNGPARAAGLPRVPAPYGPVTRTPPPQIIQRADWSGGPGGPITRTTPHGIILHQIGADGLADPLPFLRALATYDTQTLEWDDLPFHFIIDADGAIYEGCAGGPTAAVPRLDGGDDAIHIALIGRGAPPAPQQAALAGLLAWLGQAYDIAPLGQHTFSAGSGPLITRKNIVTHAEAVADAADAAPQLRAQIDAIRQSADQATVRSRWYFAEGNVRDYVERLSVLNANAGAANVRITLLRQPGPPVIRDVTLAADGRADLVVNNVFSDTTDVPAIVESNAPVIAERFMDFGSDITAAPGVSQPSRVWYFAEGSTDGDFKTFLLLFNPQSEPVDATITYMKGDGALAPPQAISIPPLQRAVVTVADAPGMQGIGFGTRVIAAQPIIAERTMIFGPGSTLTTGGVHTTPGVVTLSRQWYFAEGTTQAPFQMWVLVLNPNAQSTNAAVTFLTPDGTSLTRNYAIPPTTRLAINVNEVVPDLGVATTVRADRPVAAERAMYWKDGGAGTVAPGAIEPAFTWRFADGRTSGDYREYLLFSNPNKNQAKVSVDFIQADGRKGSQTIVMPGGSRYTMAVQLLYPGQTAIAATVRSTQPIVAERSLYPNAPDTPDSRGGATSLGVPEVGP